MKKFSKVLGLGFLVATGVANAADPMTVTIDTTNYVSIAGGVLLALGVFYGVKKAIGLVR